MRTSFALLLAVLLLCTPETGAQTPGTCETGRAEADLDVSDVRARAFTTGSLAYGNATTSGNGYLVPARTGNSPLFAAGIWIGGTVEGELRVAGSTYNDFEFWPGPLLPGGALPNPDDCSAYDRIWQISADDVARYEETGFTTSDLREWPAHLGAPVVDGDGRPNNYDLERGDRPKVFGSQTLFWVMNDVGNDHRQSRTDPIGLEVQVTAFAIASADPAFDQATFYRYRVVNRNTQPFEDAHFGLFADTDLGDASDDFVGVDTTRGMAFTYNAEDADDQYGIPPAFGADFLDEGLGAFAFFFGGSGPTSDPGEGRGMYNYLQGLWGDGTPYTEMGTGYQTDGPETTFLLPGNPVTGSFWSEENTDGNETRNTGGDRRWLASSTVFSLETGKAKDFGIALVFGQGEDRLQSITALRAASDDIQAAYDDGSLFDTVQPPTLPLTLSTPTALNPGEGALEADTVRLEWSPIPGATYYRVEVDDGSDFAERTLYYTRTPSYTLDTGDLPFDEVTKVFWRVRAEEDGPRPFGVSLFSETRRFDYYEYADDLFGEGDRIVEIAHPATDDVCQGEPSTGPDPDPGCLAGLGNTVWEDPNATDDYFLTSGSSLGSLVHDDIIRGDDFEMRFTEQCATFGACLGAYLRNDGEIASVPFELWNVRDTTTTDDDVRMIPLLRTTGESDPLVDWAAAFPGTFEDFVVAPGDTLDVPLSHRVFFSMPDREDGYARFEAAAHGFGGPGALYDRANDGDEQVDLNADGSECAQQGAYIDFCYRSVAPYRAPVGGSGSAGLQVADLAGALGGSAGPSPAAGTTVRFVSNDVKVDVPVDPGAFSKAALSEARLDAIYPNPFQSSATVAYTLGAASEVHLSVYDVLGRRVAVLAEGLQSAGPHRAAFGGAGLASGVYVVVLEAGGERASRKLMLLR